MVKNRPHIFEYLDYRQFLKDMYAYYKNSNPIFSFRFFAKQAGLKSTNYLKLVMEGERNLSSEAIYKFAGAFKLNKKEVPFFESLVFFAQAKSTEEKNRHYERIAETKCYNQVKEIESHQYDYFSHWHYVAIRELVGLKGFREDPQWINRKLGLNLSEAEIKKAIATLIKLNLVIRDDCKRLQQTEHKIVINPELSSLTILNYHKEMIKRAAHSLENSATSNRDISALTVGISEAQYKKIQERINQFRHEVHAIAAESKDPDAVYQLNFHLFNLSEVPWK